jgi:hypothetical protein
MSLKHRRPSLALRKTVDAEQRRRIEFAEVELEPLKRAEALPEL